MRQSLKTFARRTGVITLGILTSLAIPAALLRFAAEMPSHHTTGIRWQPWMVIAFIALDLMAIILLVRFRRLWGSWFIAAAFGLAPFVSLFTMSR